MHGLKGMHVFIHNRVSSGVSLVDVDDMMMINISLKCGLEGGGGVLIAPPHSTL